MLIINLLKEWMNKEQHNMNNKEYFEKYGITKRETFNKWKLIHLDNMSYWLKLYKETNDEQYYEKYKKEQKYYNEQKEKLLKENDI